MPSGSTTEDLPSSLVFEALSSRVTVETVSGDIYKGKLVVFDISRGNVELTDVRHQAKDSSFGFYERVTIRGSNIRILFLPPEVKGAPSLQWQKDMVLQELKKSLRRVPAPRVTSAPRPALVKKAPFKADKSKRLRRKLG